MFVLAVVSPRSVVRTGSGEAERSRAARTAGESAMPGEGGAGERPGDSDAAMVRSAPPAVPAPSVARTASLGELAPASKAPEAGERASPTTAGAAVLDATAASGKGPPA